MAAGARWHNELAVTRPDAEPNRGVADVETGTGPGADPAVILSDGQCLSTVASAEGCG